MKKILGFCFFPAFAPPSSGGESRLLNFYKGLSKFHQITLLTSTHTNVEEERVDHNSNFIERRIPKDLHYQREWDQLLPYGSGADLSAVCTAATAGYPTPLQRAYLEEYAQADIIIHDFPFTVNYDLFFNLDDKVRIYNAHNCETRLYQTLHPEAKSQPIWDIVKTAEIKMLSGCDAVLYCSPDDLMEFKRLAPEAEYTTIFAPNGMTPSIKGFERCKREDISSVLFMGSSHPPNVDAACKIVNDIAPALPEITFNIIGNCLPEGKYPANVVRHGFVDDDQKETLIAQADLAINPMGQGSGSNVKVFDLFAYGLPVLSSEFGMRGIEATSELNCLIAPITDFPKTIKLWSKRPAALRQIGEKGRDFAVNNYSWDVIAKKVVNELTQVSRQKPWKEKFILLLGVEDCFKPGAAENHFREIFLLLCTQQPLVRLCFSEDEKLGVSYINRNLIVCSVPKTAAHCEALTKVNLEKQNLNEAQQITALQFCRANALWLSIYNNLKTLCHSIVVDQFYLAAVPIHYYDRFIYVAGPRPIHALEPETERLEQLTVEQAAAVITTSAEEAEFLVAGAQGAGPVVVIADSTGGPTPLAGTTPHLKNAARNFFSLLQNLETPKKRVLFVTYRYTHPNLGGAESHLEYLIAALDRTNQFQIDVIAPEVSKISNWNRFAELYQFDRSLAVKNDMRNVRFARFPLDEGVDIRAKLAAAWRAQILFEKSLYLQHKDRIDVSGLAWGWSEPAGSTNPCKWAYVSCGLYLERETRVRIKGYAPKPIVVWVKDEAGFLIKMQKLKGTQTLEFRATGTIEITSSAGIADANDHRALAFLVSELEFDQVSFDLSQPLLPWIKSDNDMEWFKSLDKAQLEVRTTYGINLTEMRGPFSTALENYLDENVQHYDLVVTHNNIFRPAVAAVAAAKRAGVRTISLPHAHLDDDFYHFPDVQQSIINSDLVLAAPRITCDFYRDKGANVEYAPAGIDCSEIFSNTDIEEFKRVWNRKQPFVLVLGRKSNSKGYRKVIEAVEKLALSYPIHTVLIGPDDDGLPITSADATYLGRQPRSVVRGALLSCKVLVNMSTSESFGIVLLEAWLAGKAVIANCKCAAFHDLAQHNHNALLVNDADSLEQAIHKIMQNPDLANRLADNGAKILADYDWSQIGTAFTNFCK